jgi:Transmembrane adaptor Erv26
VWLVPFALFVSLSAGENVLPSMSNDEGTRSPQPNGNFDLSGSASAGGKDKGDRKGLAKAVVDGVRGWTHETGEVMGLWREDKRRF